MTHDNRMYTAWVVAIAAALGSLYFSKVRHFILCVLCWFQRIFMYPLVLVLGVAAFRGMRVGACMPCRLPWPGGWSHWCTTWRTGVSSGH